MRQSWECNIRCRIGGREGPPTQHKMK
uniref:Uncharacterized protein n=1 Tax=Anguilla anguilla TaxID=7936 RepID=A0A0E9SYN6_ANGAN